MVDTGERISNLYPQAEQGRSLVDRWKTIAVVAILLVVSGWAVTVAAGDPPARAATARSGVATTHGTEAAQGDRADVATTTTTVLPPVATTTSTTEVKAPVKAPPVTTQPIVAPVVAPVVAPPVAAPPIPSVAALVAEIEASGIEPGPNWSWSMGDTGAHCGAMAGAGTGCTYGSNGSEFSVFSGSPTLALVAHELANAETQNDAVPDLLNEVAAAAAGSSWSPTDAVASCLVAHFMGIQDHSAGPWECPVALAVTVAANIHDSL
jgi:hypothetical protein